LTTLCLCRVATCGPSTSVQKHAFLAAPTAYRLPPGGDPCAGASSRISNGTQALGCSYCDARVNPRVGLTLGPGRSLMHGVAPHRCDQVAGPLLGGDAGGRSPGVLSSRLGILDAVLKSDYSQIQLLQSHSFVRGAPLPHHAPMMATMSRVAGSMTSISSPTMT